MNLNKTYFPARIGLSPPPNAGTRILVVGKIRYRPCLAYSRHLVLRRDRRVFVKVSLVVETVSIGHTMVNVRYGGPSMVRLFRGVTAHRFNVRMYPLGVRCPRNNRGRLVSTALGHRIPDNTLPVTINTIMRGITAYCTICRTMRLGGPLVSHMVAIAKPSMRGPDGLHIHFNAPLGSVVRTINKLPRGAKGLVLKNPVVNHTVDGVDSGASGHASKLLVFPRDVSIHGPIRGYVHYNGYISTYPVTLRPCLLSGLVRHGV